MNAKVIVVGVIIGFFLTLFLLGVARELIDVGKKMRKRKGSRRK